MFKRRGSDLKRTLVDHNGMSPIGLLRWCLQQPRQPKPAIGGIFATVYERFGGVPDETYELISRINAFRNDYVAHQNKVLADAAQARSALVQWRQGLVALWRLHGTA